MYCLPVKHRDLWEILKKNQVWKKVLPSLNLWCVVALIEIIVWGIYDAMVSGLVAFFGVVIWWAVGKEVREALHSYWHELPQLRFHSVLIAVELGVVVVWSKAIVAAIGFVNKGK